MTSSFRLLCDDLREQIRSDTESRKWAQLGRDVVNGGERARQRGKVMLKSFSDAAIAQQAQIQEQRILEKGRHRQRCVNLFEESKIEFAKAIAAGEVVGAEITKYELYLQTVGERISHL